MTRKTVAPTWNAVSQSVALLKEDLRKAQLAQITQKLEKEVAEIAQRDRKNSFGGGGHESAIRSLASTLRSEAVEPLLHLLGRSTSKHEMRVIVELLGELGDGRAAPMIAQLWMAEGFQRHSSPAGSLRKLEKKAVVDALLSHIDSDEVLSLLGELGWQPQTPLQRARLMVLRGTWESLYTAGPEEKMVFDKVVAELISGSRKLGYHPMNDWLSLAKCLAKHRDSRAIELCSAHLLGRSGHAVEILTLLGSREAFNALVKALPEEESPRVAIADALSRWSVLPTPWNQELRAALSWIVELFNDKKRQGQTWPVYAQLFERGIETFARELDDSLLRSAAQVPDQQHHTTDWSDDPDHYYGGRTVVETIDCSRIRQLANQELLRRRL